MPDSQPASSPATLSGRRITVVVLITLLVTGLLFYWVTTSYSIYNAARRQSDRTWRALAVVLDERYQEYDAQVAQARQAEQLDAATAEQWQATRDSFSRTSLTAHQIEAAQKLEQMIAALPASFRLPAVDSSRVRELYRDYAAAAETQRVVGRSAGSHMLKLMLNLPEAPAFSLAESPAVP